MTSLIEHFHFPYSGFTNSKSGFTLSNSGFTLSENGLTQSKVLA